MTRDLLDEWKNRLWTGAGRPKDDIVRKFVDQLFREDGERVFISLVRFGKFAHDLARDAVLEAFVKAYQKWALQDIAPSEWEPVAYVTSIAKNLARNKAKKERKTVTGIDLATIAPVSANMDPPVTTESDGLLGLLEKLSEADRLILTMQYVEGLDLKEIGERLDLTHAAVRQRAVRARDRLRRLLPPALLKEMAGSC